MKIFLFETIRKAFNLDITIYLDILLNVNFSIQVEWSAAFFAAIAAITTISTVSAISPREKWFWIFFLILFLFDEIIE